MRIIYFDIDTLRPDHLGCYGYHRNTSPNIDKIANVSAGTIPIALDQAKREGKIQPGDHILMSAFGGGFTWAGVVVRF